jgi:fructose transport system substrate-binding protein
VPELGWNVGHDGDRGIEEVGEGEIVEADESCLVLPRERAERLDRADLEVVLTRENRRRRLRATKHLRAYAALANSARPIASTANIKVGLITKDVTNPFFVKMRAGATAQAKKLGATLIYAAGKNSSDNASQITAIENMVTAGVKGILIAVADAKDENAAIAKARKAGVLMIALDSPTSPTSAVDALFATNNLNAGILIGKYARAATRGKTVTIAMLDEHAGSSVGALRHNGFTQGFGIKNSNKQIVCVANGGSDTPDSQTAMENCLQKNPDINVVYTINEPSAAGAWTALKNAGKSTRT